MIGEPGSAARARDEPGRHLIAPADQHTRRAGGCAGDQHIGREVPAELAELPEDRLAIAYIATAFFLALFCQRLYIYDRMNTFFKLYLEASEPVRAQRRASQLRGSGASADTALMHGEVGARDRTDASRSAAPMRPADDAHVLDTGAHGIDEVVQTALELWAAVAADSPAAKPPRS